MLLADLRVADAQTPTPGGIDQRPCLFAWRVLEGRTARAAAQRLRFLARGSDAVHFGLDDSRLLGMATEGGADDDTPLRQGRMAIGIAKLLYRERPLLARTQHDLAFDQHVLGLAAISPAIHAHEAADRAGDRPQEFHPANPRIARGGGDEDAARPTAAAQRGRIEPFDRGEGLAQADDDASNAAIAHDHVGAEAERHHRHCRVERGEEGAEISDILGFEQPLRGAARFEPDERCQRGVLGHAAFYSPPACESEVGHAPGMT